MAFDKKEGEFERYKGTDAKLRGLVHCGGVSRNFTGSSAGYAENMDGSPWRDY